MRTTLLANQAINRLIQAVQELSTARHVEIVQAITRIAARELTGADGATFILRDGNQCHYVDEDAIGPLWKGNRFPMRSCISGWVMLNKKPAIIPDIYADDRIPHSAYRPTFVKSLVVVPIRANAPIGAIGNYWATHHKATDDEVELLQALANSTALALENVELYQGLEKRVAERTAQLQAINQELESFSYTVSHDLRSPLRIINGFSEELEQNEKLRGDAGAMETLNRIRSATVRMGHLIEDLLKLAQVSKKSISKEPISITNLANQSVRQLREADPNRQVEVYIEDGLETFGDPAFLGPVMDNLIQNAWKFAKKNETGKIHVGQTERYGNKAFFVQDNGIGFEAAVAERIFKAFERLHPASEYPGTGIGLATVQRIIQRHGGKVWAESQPGQGATFYFILPPS